MGANEKHDAIYHGGEYTPIRGNLIRVNDDKGNELFSILSDGTVQGELEHASQAAKIFMSELRGLTEVIRAEAKAEALNEVANAFQYKAWSELIQGSLQDRLRVAQPITDWLRARANQYKEEPANGR